MIIAPTRGLPGALPNQHLVLFNNTNNGKQTNHVVAVELDTIYNSEFNDINDNHVGIDINGLESERSASAGYYSQLNGKLTNLTLISGHPMQVWIEYDGMEKQMNVTIAPIDVDKPSRPLLTLSRDLSPILNSSMYIGFSSSTSNSYFASQYILIHKISVVCWFYHKFIKLAYRLQHSYFNSYLHLKLMKLTFFFKEVLGSYRQAEKKRKNEQLVV